MPVAVARQGEVQMKCEQFEVAHRQFRQGS